MPTRILSKGWKDLMPVRRWEAPHAFVAQNERCMRQMPHKHEHGDSISEHPLCLLVLCMQLDTLNLSSNYIKRVENVAHLSCLTTLLLANNRLETSDDLRSVLRCPSLQVRRSAHYRRSYRADFRRSSVQARGRDGLHM